MGDINRVVITNYYHKLITPRKVSLAIGYLVSLILVAIATYLMTTLAISGFLKVILTVSCVAFSIILIRELISTFVKDKYVRNQETINKLKDVYYLDDLQSSIESTQLYILSEFINTEESTKKELIIDIPAELKPVTDENMKSMYVSTAVDRLYQEVGRNVDEKLLNIIEDVYYKNK